MGATGLHRNRGLKVKTGRGGSNDDYGGGATTNQRLHDTRLSAANRDDARGDGAAYDTCGVSYRAERQSRSGGFRMELHRWTAADSDGELQTVADSVEMLFDSVGQFRNEVQRT